MIALNLKIKHKATADQELTVSIYDSLFYEFKDDKKAIESNFYTLYFTRRLVFILSIFFLESYPILQICLFEIFCLSVLNI